MTKQEEKDYAISTLGEIKRPIVGMFMGIDINEFTKDELIKILSLQHEKWLISIGFSFSKEHV